MSFLCLSDFFAFFSCFLDVITAGAKGKESKGIVTKIDIPPFYRFTDGMDALSIIVFRDSWDVNRL